LKPKTHRLKVEMMMSERLAWTLLIIKAILTISGLVILFTLGTLSFEHPEISIKYDLVALLFFVASMFIQRT
jgi:hypothetical protein